jgi:hypothetical protein
MPLFFMKGREALREKICVLDTCNFETDPNPWIPPLDPDPALFVGDFQDANKKYGNIFAIFFAYYLLWVP